jgi:hypothetical protein
MNPNSPKLFSRRKHIGPTVMALLLVAWMAFWLWVFRYGGLLSFLNVYLPLFLVGLVLVLAGNVFVRLLWGQYRHGWGWLIGREARRLCFWSVLVAVSTLALFYNFQWWLGQRAWASVAQAARQQGEELVDLETLLGGPVPDDRNLARIRLFEPIFTGMLQRDDECKPMDTGTNRAALAAIKLGDAGWSSGIKQLAWLNGEPTDFRPWLAKSYEWERELSPAPLHPKSHPLAYARLARAAAAREILASLALFDDAFRQLHDNRARPFCRFPETSWDYENYGFASLNGFLLGLSVRASAEVALGDSEAAHQDVELLLQMDDYLRQQGKFWTPMLIADSLQPVWEGLAARQWTEPQLHAIQNRLAGWNILGDYPVFWRMEATRLADSLEVTLPTGRIRPDLPQTVMGRDEQIILRVIRWLFPAGWSLHDQANIQRERLRAIADFKRSACPLPARVTNWQLLIWESDPLFLTFVVPKLKQMRANEDSFLLAQSAVNLATVACALERHRLARGQYPDTLGALAPDFIAALPDDVMVGRPLHYRRTADDRFLLYSTGFDRTDDGGTPCPRGLNWEKKPSLQPELGEGDWVWTYPAGDAR